MPWPYKSAGGHTVKAFELRVGCIISRTHKQINSGLPTMGAFSSGATLDKQFSARTIEKPVGGDIESAKHPCPRHVSPPPVPGEFRAE
jgi:hypothetical protein